MAARVEPQIVTAQPTFYAPVAQHTSTVVVQQPSASKPERQFTTGLCGCFEDMGICIYAWLCPSCFLSTLANDMGESCIMPCCVPNPLIPMRAAWRNRHNIKGSIQNDCCVATFCYQCALCQLAIDIKHVRQVGH